MRSSRRTVRLGWRWLRSAARIDLLVTDVGLPDGLNGRQVADAARVIWLGLQVLFITGYAADAVLSRSRLEPGIRVVTKPFSLRHSPNSLRIRSSTADAARRSSEAGELHVSLFRIADSTDAVAGKLAAVSDPLSASLERPALSGSERRTRLDQNRPKTATARGCVVQAGREWRWPL
jgi:CheY-like chemotaxis protein